nr:PREDICTED: tumor necrosis factor receptor superfamily member 6 isoform X2 [Lepisosteus oculatus]
MKKIIVSKFTLLFFCTLCCAPCWAERTAGLNHRFRRQDGSNRNKEQPVEIRCSKGEQFNNIKNECEPCPEDTYMEDEHIGEKCLNCDKCEAAALLEEESQCTKTQNRKCRCQEHSYCPSPPCKQCHRCKTCEGRVAQTCTRTNDTVCGERGSTSVIAPVIITCIVLLLIVGIGILWKKRLYCFGNRNKREHQNMEQENRENLLNAPEPGVNLEPFLYQIADRVELKYIKQLALESGITPARVQMIMLNDQHDAREQGVNLLKEWNQRRGLANAFPDLIEQLRKMKLNKAADELQSIIEKHHSSI